MVDLGGGSCELTISSKGHIRDTVSLPLGAVRLTNEFLTHDPPRKAELRRLRGFVEREIGRIADRINEVAAENRDRHFRHGRFSGSGLSWVVQDERSARHCRSRAPRCDLSRRCWRVCPLSSARSFPALARDALKSWSPARWSTAELLERCQLSGFRYSPLGLRDGLLAQMAAEYDRSTRSGKHIESERWDSILTAVAHYRVDLNHALQVRQFAMYLFKALKSLHRLPTEYEEWISAAAMLYEVGDYVNRNGRHRHAYYIIAHSEILGYTPDQRRIIAATARYLGKSRPAPGDTFMKILPPDDRSSSAKPHSCCGWHALSTWDAAALYAAPGAGGAGRDQTDPAGQAARHRRPGIVGCRKGERLLS